MDFQVVGDPHPWPRNARTEIGACAVTVVDMQGDYCLPGYYIARAGYDTNRLNAPVGPIQRVLTAARRQGLQVIYTRHSRTVDNDRLGTPELTNAEADGSAVRTAAPGEPGWEIIPALRPQPDDVIVEKTTCSAFVSGELDRLLRSKGIRCLAFCGNTIDVCVHSTLRSAVDLGYECLLLADCCGAVNDGLHAWALESVKIEDGVFGTVADAAAFVGAFGKG